MSASDDESIHPRGEKIVGKENDENTSDDEEMRDCEEVAQVTFREGGDDFSPKIESETPQRRMLQPQKILKDLQAFCSVPGCRSEYLIEIGAKLSSYQIPPQNTKARLKWIRALGKSLEDENNVDSCKICELHFAKSCIISSGSNTFGRKMEKRLKPNSFPTLNIPITEDSVDNRSSKFRADVGSLVTSGLRRAKSSQCSITSLDAIKRNKLDYRERVEQIIKESGLRGPPSFIEDLMSKLGVQMDSEDNQDTDTTQSSQLPPCTILKPVAKDGEAPLPAIVLPGIDHSKAVELLEDENIQELLKKMAEKHKDEMIKKMALEGDEEEIEEKDEHGGLIMVKRKKAIPPPPAIILQATELCPEKSPDQMLPDNVQRVIDKTFKEQKIAGKGHLTRRQELTTDKKSPRKCFRLNHEDFLESLPPIESKYVLDEDGNVIPAPTGDHDYGQSSRNSGISIFDPAGLRQEIERRRLEVEFLRQKNFELTMLLADAKFSRSSGIRSRGSANEQKKLEKLEVANQKMGEELVRLKLERRRMLGKERNRRRKRQKVLERRQKRRDWIMQQIELGTMTKEHLELVYSRKKLPYEKKAHQSNNLTVFPISIPTGENQPITVTVQHPMIPNDSTGQVSRSVVPKKRSRLLRKANEDSGNFDELSGVTSVVVTDLQHQDLNDENVVAVSGVPGVVITGRLHGTHQIIVEGPSENYTPEQIDMIVKVVDDLEVNSWRMASSP